MYKLILLLLILPIFSSNDIRGKLPDLQQSHEKSTTAIQSNVVQNQDLFEGDSIKLLKKGDTKISIFPAVRLLMETVNSLREIIVTSVRGPASEHVDLSSSHRYIFKDEPANDVTGDNERQLSDMRANGIQIQVTSVDTPTETKSVIESSLLTATVTESPSEEWLAASLTDEPSHKPSSQPTSLSLKPSIQPITRAPTDKPSHKPTHLPTDKPTHKPSHKPTHSPTEGPSDKPTHSPTDSPITDDVTEKPSKKPTHAPTSSPASNDDSTAKPTRLPTVSSDSSSSESSLPNIIFCMADDLGWNSLGYEDFDLSFATPFMSTAARSGIIMNNYYSQEMCTPARAGTPQTSLTFFRYLFANCELISTHWVMLTFVFLYLHSVFDWTISCEHRWARRCICPD